MRVLVTGSTGLIGTHLTRKLEDLGYEVLGVSKSTGLDLNDKEKASEVIKDFAPEVVYHLAANAAEGLSIYSPSDMTQNGIGIFMNTIVPAINAGELKRFIFTSSVAVYGQIPTPFKEIDVPHPVDIYGLNKLAIENALAMLADVHEFEHVIARPHNVYGEHQKMDNPYRNVVMLWMNGVLRDEPYTIYGDGSMARQFSYVGDVVEVLAKMASYGDIDGLVFNVGSDRATTLKELSDAILDVSGTDMEPGYLPQRVHEVHSPASDHTLVKRVFGYEDTDFNEGIEKTWDWVKGQGAKEYKYKDPEIISDKYPKNWKK